MICRQCGSSEILVDPSDRPKTEGVVASPELQDSWNRLLALDQIIEQLDVLIHRAKLKLKGGK
jgi:hypothetical protein